MNSAVLSLCIIVGCVYVLPINCNVIDVNRTTEIYPQDIDDVQVPIEIQYQDKINITTETPTTKSNGTYFRIHNVVDVKDNGCPTNYLRDIRGECRQVEN